MTAYAGVRNEGKEKTVSTFNVIVFFAVLALWIGFGAILILSRETMADLWSSFRGQPAVLKGVEGFLLLPWVVGMAVWEASWALWMRLVIVVGLAWATIYVFFPWKPGG